MTALDDAVLNWKFVNALGGQRAHDELNKLHAMELENERLKKAVRVATKVMDSCIQELGAYTDGVSGMVLEWLKEYGKDE